MAHTKRPWTVRTLENFGFNVVHYVDGDKFNIQRVAKTGEEDDARLIAAAPDYHEVAPDAADLLEHYAEYIRSVPYAELERHPYLPLIEETAAALRAAIAAATQQEKADG